MALNNSTVIPKVIAAQLLLAFRKRRVYADRVNNTWRNALNAGGNEVIINRPIAGSVADYTRSTSITYNQNADVNAAGLTLQLGGTGGIGKGGVTKYWHVKFDDLDRAVSSIDLLQSSIVEYGEALATQVDSDIRSVMVANATTAGAATNAIDLDDIADDTTGLDFFGFETLHKELDWKRVPRAGRWLIVGPAFMEALQKTVLSSEQLLSTPQQSGLANGRVGSIAGFTIYMGDPAESTHTAKKGAVKAFYSETVLAGVDSATAFIDRIARTERLRLESSFSDAVRGLYEYNAKVLLPERLLKRTYTFSGDSVENALSLPAAIAAS